MSLNFVTGKRGNAHISSADWRSLNRGIVGEGKFYLEDTESNSNGAFSVDASSGQITVPPRSFIWSGAHIRNDSLYVVDYVPPVSTANVVLWFHYTKDVNTGIENIEFVTTVDSQPSPVADVIEDTMLEAYTAVYSFVHNAEQLVSENGIEHFKNIGSLKEYKDAIDEVLSKSDTIDTTALKVTNLETLTSQLETSIQIEVQERVDAVSAETTERNTAINDLKSSLDEVVLFSGEAKPGDTINLNESLRNFRQIILMGWYSATSIVPTSIIHNTSAGFGAMLSSSIVMGDDVLGYFVATHFKNLNDTKLELQKSSAVMIGTSITTANANTVLKIVGVGRKG